MPPWKRYSEEFKQDAIALARSSDKTITEVARDLGVTPESLRGWVKRDRIDLGQRGAVPVGGEPERPRGREMPEHWTLDRFVAVAGHEAAAE